MALQITTPDEAELRRRPVLPALRNGAFCRCPACGRGRLFDGFLKVQHACEACGEELHHERAHDAPPYFTIVAVGHIVIPLVLALELALHPPVWLQVAIWAPVTLLLTLALMRPIKGATVGVQWAMRMHGFDPTYVEAPEVRPGTHSAAAVRG